MGRVALEGGSRMLTDFHTTKRVGFVNMMKISYLCIVNENDEIGAAGRKNYRPGQAENSPWAGRKNEVLSATRDNKPMFN